MSGSKEVIRLKFSEVEKRLDYGRTLSTKEKNLLKNGSKIKYNGGGWWTIIHYNRNGV